MAPVPTFCFNMQRWKQPILKTYFPQREFSFIPLYLSERRISRDWLPVIRKTPRAEVFVWGWRLPRCVASDTERQGLPITYVEDGFIRSVAPHSGRSAPFSLALDRLAPYFDARRPSELELLLGTYDFEGDEDLQRRASAALSRFLESGISKYNSSPKRAIDHDRSGLRRILVVGQVEGDASILLGCDHRTTDLNVVEAAVEENPGAEILYRPHPDVLHRVRLQKNLNSKLSQTCRVVDQPIPLSQALETVDHVYTRTSLVGFEALLRGKKVTTFGSPFYAGWGLTDDRQPNPRRGRKLSVTDLFAGAYLLYPRYFDPRSGAPITFEDTLSLIQTLRSQESPRTEAAYEPLRSRRPMTKLLASLIGRVGNQDDARNYLADPVAFFRELPSPWLRGLGRVLYPFGD